MPGQCPVGYYKTRMRKIGRYYSRGLDDRDPDAVHDLRVELKRVRAFFDFTTAVTGDFDGRAAFKGLKKIAQRTGGLRDAHVQLDLVKGMEKESGLDLDPLKSYFHDIEKRHGDRFVKFGRTHPLSKLKPRTRDIMAALSAVPAALLASRALDHFHVMNLELLRLAASDDMPQSSLHGIRKLTKRAHYTLEILETCRYIEDDTRAYLQSIQEVHGFLGSWHDHDVLRDHLRTPDPLASHRPPTGMVDALEPLIEARMNTCLDGFRASIAECVQIASWL